MAHSIPAVTGNPVPVYSLIDFFGKSSRRLQSCSAAGAFSLGRPSLPTNYEFTAPEFDTIISWLESNVNDRLSQSFSQAFERIFAHPTLFDYWYD
jgi:hypothetical protein